MADRSQIFFLTEKFLDPGSVFLPFAKLKQKYTYAFRFPPRVKNFTRSHLTYTEKEPELIPVLFLYGGDGGNRTRV